MRVLSLLNQQEFIRILNCNAMAGRVGIVQITVNGLKEKNQVTERGRRARIFQTDGEQCSNKFPNIIQYYNGDLVVHQQIDCSHIIDKLTYNAVVDHEAL